MALNYKTIKLEDMMEYIQNLDDLSEKAWFKSIAIDESGRYNHLATKKAFCERYMPEIIPVAKPKAPKKSDLLKEW